MIQNSLMHVAAWRLSMLSRIGLCALAIVLTGSLTTAEATPGNLDPAFGAGGIVITNLGRTEGTESMMAVARQPDGKLLAAGNCSTATGNAACLIRMLANGSLDPTFGNGGLVTWEGMFAISGFTMVMLDGSRVIAAGYCKLAGKYEICVAAYDQNGAPDPSFGTSGLLVLAISSNSKAAYSIGKDGSGNYVLAGNCTTNTTIDFCLIRMNASGVLDATFGVGGVAVTAIGSGTDVAYAMAFQGDKIVAAGTCHNGAQFKMCVARFLPSGALDTSFNGTGFRIFDFGPSDDSARALLIDQGLIYAGGTCTIAQTYDEVCLVRVLEDGALDVTFGGTGKLQTSSARVVYGLGMQSGKLIAGISGGSGFMWSRYKTDGTLEATFGGERGTAYGMLVEPATVTLIGTCPTDIAGSVLHACARQYRQDGAPEGTFGSSGYAVHKLSFFGAEDAANAVVQQADGRIVVAGTCFDGTRDNACVARYLANGNLDTSFASVGYRVGLFGDLGALFPDYVGVGYPNSGMAVALDGTKILVAGMCKDSFCIARLNGDGTFDTTFQSGGVLVARYSCSTGLTFGEVISVAMREGKIVVTAGCGTAFHAPNGFYLRFLADGTPDPTFNGGSPVVTQLGPRAGHYSNAGLVRMGSAIENGKITAAGSKYGNDNFEVARLNADGSPDLTLNGTGTVSINMSASGSAAIAVTLASGKIVAVGKCSNGTNMDFCVARLHQDGSLDTSFNGTGKKVIAMGDGDDIATQVAMHGQKIVIAGFCTSGGVTRYCMAVLNPDGALDSTFGGSGMIVFGAGNTVKGMYAMDLADGFATLAGTCTLSPVPSPDFLLSYDFCVARIELPSPIPPPSVPTSPSIASLVAGDSQLATTLTLPAYDGGAPVTTYSVTCLPNMTAFTSSQLTIVVTGLTNGTTYSCTATATNASGTSVASPAKLGIPTTLSLASVVSRKSHGTAGDFNLPLLPGDSLETVSIEPRSSGGSHRLIASFSAPVTQFGAASFKDANGFTKGQVGLSIESGQLVVNLSSVADGVKGFIRVDGINGFLSFVQPVAFQIANINGTAQNAQTSATASVNAVDIVFSKIRSTGTQTVNPANFLFDFNLDGFVDQRDTSLAKAQSGRRLK